MSSTEVKSDATTRKAAVTVDNAVDYEHLLKDRKPKSLTKKIRWDKTKFMGPQPI
jgi:hypothetical protein